MSQRVVCVVQARFGSSRLPGKALRPLQGRPVIAHVLERAQAIPGVDALVLATTDQPRDDLLAEYAIGLGVAVFRGSENDVLDRMGVAAMLARADLVVRVTGDCPFLDPQIAADVIALQRKMGGYAWNDTMHSGYPDGVDAEVFPMALLDEAHVKATSQRDREHVTPWIRDHHDVATLYAPFDYTWMKLSVDTFDDYQRACVIAQHLCRGQFALADTIAAYQCGCL